MDDIVEAAAELDPEAEPADESADGPEADRRRLELTAALVEAVHAADSRDVQQRGTEIHLRFGCYRVRADVTEIIRDAPQVVAPPERVIGLQEQRERQLLQGTVHNLVAAVGARVPISSLDLSALPLGSVKALRNVLRGVSEYLQRSVEETEFMASEEEGKRREREIVEMIEKVKREAAAPQRKHLRQGV